ncbi:MAG: hypothetical protein VXY93_15445, partial [Pseudomonadota bacterium]|nr:hypothetical protein [Pseudomonadota bacterium]
NLDNVSISGVSTFSGDVSIAQNIVHTGDTDTKIQFDINQFLFNTGGSTRFELDDTQARFTKVIKAEETGDNKGIRIHSNGGISATDNVLRFNTAQTNGFSFCQNSDGTSSGERFRIAGSGNISIFNDLDVDGHTNLDNVSVGGATTCNGGVVFLNSISLNASSNNYLYFDDILHFTRNGHGTEMVIDASGRVGINEGTPEAKLELDGRFRILDNSDGTPSTGKGLEISYYTSDDMADILSYDRGGG